MALQKMLRIRGKKLTCLLCKTHCYARQKSALREIKFNQQWVLHSRQVSFFPLILNIFCRAMRQI